MEMLNNKWWDIDLAKSTGIPADTRVKTSSGYYP